MAGPACGAGTAGAAPGRIMIVAGYLGFFLVLAVGTALLVVVANRASKGVRLFLRCVRWGLATGAVTGALFGAALPLIGSLEGDPGPIFAWMIGGFVYGAFFGAIVAVIPTLFGAVFIHDLLIHRHREPSSMESVQRDLTAAFAGVVGVLDVILLAVLVAVIAGGTELSSAVLSFAALLAGNACVALMLWRARTSISRLWMAEVSGAGGTRTLVRSVQTSRATTVPAIWA